MKSLNGKGVIDYLGTDLHLAIQNDLVDVLKFHEQKDISGFHSIPREVFCYIDYLGSLIEGPPATSRKAIHFIEKYMVKADIEYKHYGKIIYEMWRHGTIHEFDPKVLIHSQRKDMIGWQTNNSSKPHNRSCHLECFKIEGTKNQYLLHINLFELVDHLISALNSLISDLKKNHVLHQKVQMHFDKISKSVIVKELPRKSKSNKIKLNRQITRAIKSQKREVNKNSKVIDQLI